MAQSQYFDTLSQSEKSSDQQFYSNAEERTVQYVITPDKAPVQFPTQQIVVTSGEQLMLVDGQSQHIVIEQSGITHQGQQIQQNQIQQIQLAQQQVVQQHVGVVQQQVVQQQVVQQVQGQQYAVVQDSTVSNGTRQIYLFGSNSIPSSERTDDTQNQQQQPIVLNHQIGQNNSIRIRTPVQQSTVRAAVGATPTGIKQQGVQRPQGRPAIRSNLNQQPLRSATPNQQQIRVATPNQNASQMRAMSPGQNQIRPQTTNANQNQVRLIASNQQSPIRQANANQTQIRSMSPAFQGIRQQQGAAMRPASPAQQQQQQPRQPVSRLPGQQFRPQNSNASVVRQLGGQVRATQPRVVSQPRILGQTTRPTGLRMTSLTQNQKVTNNQGVDLPDLDIKPGDEQETVSLADGTLVSVAVYKHMLADPKSRALLQKSNNLNQVSNESVSSGLTTPAQQTPTSATGPATAKKRTTTPRPRPPPKGIPNRAPAKNRAVSQFSSQEDNSTQQSANDPSRYAMTQQYNNQPQSSPHQQQQQQQQRPMIQQLQQRPSQANYVIQPPKMNQRPQQQRPLPSYIPSSQIQKIIENTPISEEFTDSIRMLVLLENGEQRLITFTLPKEPCTIQEILEQVNVPFQSNTNIQVTEANSSGINYIVTVGNVAQMGYEEDDCSMPEEPAQHPPTPPQLPPSPPNAFVSQQQMQQSVVPPAPAAREESPPPEPVKDLPKYVPGMLALCGACGYLSEDFNKCMRCQRKLPENVKSITATLRATGSQKRESLLAQQRAQQSAQQQQQQSVQQPQSPQPQNQQKQALSPHVQQTSTPQLTPSNSTKTTPAAMKNPGPAKKKTSRSKNVEIESVHVISSDEEDDEKPPKVNTSILSKLGAAVTICPISKEPSPLDIQKMVSSNKHNVQLDDECVNTTLICRTVRIGSYRCVPAEKKVLVDSKFILMKVPHPSLEKQMKVIRIETNAIVKVLASFNTALPVFFYYLNPAHAKLIRETLGMTPGGDYYFDPLSTEEEAHRRITLLPDDLAEDDRDIFQLIYDGMMDELNPKEANDILIKTCPKDVSKATLSASFTEIKQLLTYPPEGRGRIAINTEDYICLASDQFLNDVIIDFYLKYVVDNLPVESRCKVHVFSTFFYKRLTTKPVKASRKSQPTELDPTLTASQKRHARVKTWTKNVNLFEKDFVIVPINENAHWFLAIICFPGMSGCQTWDGKPYVEEPRPKPKKKVKVGSIGNVSVNAVKQEKLEKAIVCEDPELSDKDEAEGEDSEMESDDSEDTTSSSQNSASPISAPPTPAPSTPTIPKSRKEPRPPIKQPCILIFDSLAGASRSRVVATLRDYLTCEYKAKLDQERIFDRDCIKGACPKIPQQNNFTDCGLYVLQYVEQFFNDPIKDYHIPIKEIKDWFEEIVVTRKREEIANLIKTLMKEYGKDTSCLPDIAFPTINGTVVDRDFEDEEMEEDEEEPDEEFSSFNSKEADSEDNRDESLQSAGSDCKAESEELNLGSNEMKTEEPPSPLKPSSVSEPGDFITQPAVNPKPDLREFPRQTSKDTLSMLKAKRIIRHKPTGGPDLKKHKSDQVP